VQRVYGLIRNTFHARLYNSMSDYERVADAL